MSSSFASRSQQVWSPVTVSKHLKHYDSSLVDSPCFVKRSVKCVLSEDFDEVWRVPVVVIQFQTLLLPLGQRAV